MIIANPSKPWALVLKDEVANFMKSKGIDDICVVIGGDGTLLYNLNKISKKPVMIIGTSKSYLAQATVDNWRGKLLSWKKHKRVERLKTIIVEAEKQSYEALNEVVVRRKTAGVQTFTIRYGRAKHTLTGDGVIIATPCGSTGYAFSNGGPILERDVRAWVVVPVAPYLRKNPVRVVRQGRRVMVESTGPFDIIVDSRDQCTTKRVMLKPGREILFAKP